jgi:hypothetical protein
MVPAVTAPVVLPARSLRPAAGMAIVGLAAIAASELLSLVVSTISASAAQQARLALLLVEFAGYALAVPGFLSWLFQASRNLDRWQIERSGWRTPWTLTGWLIPFADFVIPKLVVDMVWSGSELEPRDRVAVRTSNPLILWWWLTFLASGWASNLSSRASWTAAAKDGDVGATVLATFASLSTVVAAFLAVLIVRQVTRLQEARQAQLDAWARTVATAPRPTIPAWPGTNPS